MSDEAYEKHQAELTAAIAALAEGNFVSHYVVVAVTSTGTEDGTHLITSPDLPQWMCHGLLSYEAAATVPQPMYEYCQEDE